MISVNQLIQYPLFSGLSENELATLANVLVKHTFAKNAYIYYPGNPGLNLYLVESGVVRLFMINTNGEEFLLDLIKPRRVFGLPGLMGTENRPAGAAALETACVLTIPRVDMFHFIEIYPQFTRNLMMEMASDLRNLLEHTQALACLSLKGRLVTLFLHLIRSNENQAEKLEMELPLTQAELASWVGASRGRVNRELSKLQQQGLIDISGQKLKITDLRGLELLAGE
jgi:CRP-like cAMP-binding protein